MAQQPFMFNPNPAGGYRSALEDLQLAEILAPYGAEEKSIANQLKQAEALRDTDAPQGLNPTGRVFTQAQPLEFAGAFAKRVSGQQGTEKSFEKMQGMTKKLAAEFKKKIKEMEDREQTAQLQKQAQAGQYGPPEGAMPGGSMGFGVAPDLLPEPMPELPAGDFFE